ncbi:MAG: hypothetical protein K1X55_08355 [Chitinophagales bacterium]|nr:hypothetical protein [Chitinophagales bacterium]
MKAEYNSKLDKNMEAFIQLRIEGKSFDEIATELKTTKQTLICWNKKELIRNAINEGKAFKINTLIKTYQFDFTNRLKTYLELSKKINTELLNRDLTEINTDVLLKMSIANDSRINDMIQGKKIDVGESENTTYMNDGDNFFELKFDE